MTNPIAVSEEQDAEGVRPSCVATRGERLLRGAAAVFVAGFALSSLANPWVAITAGIGSIWLMVGAITGRCPT